MRIHKLYIALGLILALGLFFELAAHAAEANQETRITFSAPIQIPGNTIGHEFNYPKQQEQEIAQARRETFVGNQLMPSPQVAGE